VEWTSYKFLTIPITYIVGGLNIVCASFPVSFQVSLKVFLWVFSIGSPRTNSNLIARDGFSAGTKTLKTALHIFSKLECKEMLYQSLSFGYAGNCQSVPPMAEKNNKNKESKILKMYGLQFYF